MGNSLKGDPGKKADKQSEPKNVSSLLWTVPEFRQRVKDANGRYGKKVYFSDPFYSSDLAYKMRCKLVLYGNRLNTYIEFMRSEYESAKHAAPVFYHKRTFMLLDRSQREPKRHIVRTQEPIFGARGVEEAERWMTRHCGPQVFLADYSLLSNNFDAYAPNDTIQIKVVVEPLSKIMRTYFGKDGTLVWRVDNFSRRKRDDQLRVVVPLESESFYTGVPGYRMKAKLYFTYSMLTVYLFFFRGKYDDQLPATFPHKRTFTILDQISPGGEQSIVKCQTLDPADVEPDGARDLMVDDRWARIELAPLADVERVPFLINDEVVIRVVVEPLGPHFRT